MFITTTDVAPWVQADAADLDDDPLALKTLDRACLLVNETAWGTEDPTLYWETYDKPAPETIKAIAEQVFARVYQNPKTLAAETTGPLTDRYAEAVLTGMELRPSEIERIHKLVAGVGTGGRLFLLNMSTSDEVAVDDTTVPYVDAYSPHPAGVTYFPINY